MFKPLVYFELSCEGCDLNKHLFLLENRCPNIPGCLDCLSLLSHLYTSVGDAQVTVVWLYFWSSFSFLHKLCCPGDFRFIVIMKVSDISLPTLLLFFKTALVVLLPRLSTYTADSAFWYFVCDCITSVNQFIENWHLKSTAFSSL